MQPVTAGFELFLLPLRVNGLPAYMSVYYMPAVPEEDRRMC